MRKRSAAALILAGAVLILDSRCALRAARDALSLCAGTLVPSLFPLFVICAMLVPGLQNLRIPGLSRVLGMPVGSEGIWLLGVCGGFPVGAACIAQSAQNASLSDQDARRMLGLCSLCGPSFLFGVLPQFLSFKEVISIFVLQLETSLLLCAFWPGRSTARLASSAGTVSLPEAVRRAIDSMLCVCAWVTLAAVAAGFLRRWIFPLMPQLAGITMTGLLELTNGIFSLPEEHRFELSALFVCFGGISVLLQIGGLAAQAGLSMSQCILQKAVHGMLGLLLAALWLRFGFRVFLFIPALLFVKMTLEIPRDMVYNGRERKGSRCYFEKRWSTPASTAGLARK